MSPSSQPDLHHGVETVAVPGPTIIPESVRLAMAKPMVDIYEGELPELAHRLMERLPALARTTAPALCVIGNGHGAWQMAINNTLSRGDKVLVLESGLFAVVWGQQAQVSGVEVEVLAGRPNRRVDPEALQQRLALDRSRPEGPEIKAVLTVQTDTASSVRNDIAALRQAIDAAEHPALFFVDCIASLGCEPYEMDAWGADLTVGAAQKGLMVPPGIAFVWAGPRAIEAYEAGPDLVDGYLDWGPRLNPQATYQLFSGTPPIPHLYALDVALSMIDDEGLEARWQRHQILAETVWAAVQAWEAPGGLKLLVEHPAERSTAVTTVATGDAVDPRELCRVAKERAGVVLGAGVGGLDHCFRIGHMGYLNPPMLLGTLGALEAALHALGAPMAESGLAAGAAHLGRHLLANR